MSSDADAHKVGLIPVTLMVSGNIMGSGVFLLPANLAATGGIAIYGWLVTIIGALALSMVYAKMSSLDPSPGGSYAYARRCFGPFLGYQTNVLYWLACWIGNIAMVVIGVGYLSYFFPILKDPLVLTLTCVAVLWIFVLLNIVGPKMITRVQAVATILALVPIVGIAVFGWFWFKGETYMAAWNVSGMNTFGAIQNAMVIHRGRKRLRCGRGGEKSETQRAYRHHRRGTDRRRLLRAFHNGDYGDDPQRGAACIGIAFW